MKNYLVVKLWTTVYILMKFITLFLVLDELLFYNLTRPKPWLPRIISGYQELGGELFNIILLSGSRRVFGRVLRRRDASLGVSGWTPGAGNTLATRHSPLSTAVKCKSNAGS